MRGLTIIGIATIGAGGVDLANSVSATWINTRASRSLSSADFNVLTACLSVGLSGMPDAISMKTKPGPLAVDRELRPVIRRALGAALADRRKAGAGRGVPSRAGVGSSSSGAAIASSAGAGCAVKRGRDSLGRFVAVPSSKNLAGHVAAKKLAQAHARPTSAAGSERGYLAAGRVPSSAVARSIELQASDRDGDEVARLRPRRG